MLSARSWATGTCGSAEGNELVPDLAESEPEVTDDGTTYTYTLRDGVNFGPPLSRPVTPQDVYYAFKRIGTESIVAQYGFYYNVIEGMAEFTAAGGLTKKGNEISGIEMPDDKTIVFHLTQPIGDFDYRVGHAGRGTDPRGSGRVLHEGRRVRPLRDLHGRT